MELSCKPVVPPKRLRPGKALRGPLVPRPGGCSNHVRYTNGPSAYATVTNAVVNSPACAWATLVEAMATGKLGCACGIVST
jgi:hypothetical protein